MDADSYYKNILIIADIEGSSGCWSYDASRFLTRKWASACKMMSEDIAIAVKALFECGVEQVTIKDFHRTGFNILTELIDPRARVISGYIEGPVPGIGDPFGADAAMFIGLHAASGTEGFLPHTLTSRIEHIGINERILTEFELFASSIAPYGITPIFFSGCPIACEQVREIAKNITTCEIHKSGRKEDFDVLKWRKTLAGKVTKSLMNASCEFKMPEGPFEVFMTMRDGKKEAEKLSKRWGIDHRGKTLFFKADDIHALYLQLIKICYLTPFVEKFLKPGLFLHNLYGRMGLEYVRWVLRRREE